jgi:hypothetical protein
MGKMNTGNGGGMNCHDDKYVKNCVKNCIRMIRIYFHQNSFELKQRVKLIVLTSNFFKTI